MLIPCYRLLMRRPPLTPRRRRVVVLAASCAALAGSFGALQATHTATSINFYFGIAIGVAAGVVLGTGITFLIRRRDGSHS